MRGELQTSGMAMSMPARLRRALRSEHKLGFRIETPTGLSRGRNNCDPGISQISSFGPQGQAEFSSRRASLRVTLFQVITV